MLSIASPDRGNHTLSQREAFHEMLAVLQWSEDARRAYVRALRSFRRAGSPLIPMEAVDYQHAYRRERRRAQRKRAA